MTKKILFKSRGEKELFTQQIEYSKELLVDSPEIFNNRRDGYATINLVPTFCQFFIDGQPYFYYRHSDPDKTRWVGICKLGDGPFDYQKGGYTWQLSAPHKNDPIVPYGKIKDNPYTVGISTLDGETALTFTANSAKIKEKEILMYEGEYFPYAFIDHQNVWPNTSTIYQSGKVTGTFNGHSFEGAGRFDKGFCSTLIESQNYAFDFDEVNLNHELVGIREDGRREEATIDIMANGNTWAYYWLEGEEMVTSNEVEVEADWYRLPYVDDGTCIFRNITFRFGGKEIHVEGKWGHKGFTGYPRFDKKGQAEVSGPWYEGKIPYKHTHFMSFNEVQSCFDTSLIELGFDVFDAE